MTQQLAKGMKGGSPPWKEGEKIDLKIAHWCLFGPKLSGMYETTRELIAAENQIEGVLAGFCETPAPNASPAVVRKVAAGGRVDGFHPELRSQDWGWAMKWADVHMVHSTLSNRVGELVPKVYFAHGTPEACLANELVPGDKRQSFTSSANWVDRFDASFVTSKRAEQMWSVFDHTGGKVHRVTKGIDLSWWQRSSTKQDLDGDPSILYGEIWRNIKHPLYLLYAMNELYKKNKDIRLNVWGANMRTSTWDGIMERAYFKDFLGKQGMRGIIDYPEHYYTRGDVYFGSAIYGDLSRSMQEAMACGCPVATWDTDPYGDQHAYRYVKPFDLEDLEIKLMDVAEEVADDRKGVAAKCRKIATKYFNIHDEAAQVVDVLRDVVSQQ